MHATIRPFLLIAAAARQGAGAAVPRSVLREHARGALLGLALGEACQTSSACPQTTMSLALATAWLGNRHAPAAEDYAQALSHWLDNHAGDADPVVRRAILRFRASGEARIPPSMDTGTAATVRCAPVALALAGAPSDTLARALLAQARVTHHHPLTDAATLTVANMILAGLNGADAPGTGLRAVMAQAHLLTAEFPPFHFRGPSPPALADGIVASLRSALRAIDCSDSPEGALACVSAASPNPAAGALTGLIMGALHGEAALPQNALAALDPALRQGCIEVADGLIARSPAWMSQFPAY